MLVALGGKLRTQNGASSTAREPTQEVSACGARPRPEMGLDRSTFADLTCKFLINPIECGEVDRILLFHLLCAASLGKKWW